MLAAAAFVVVPASATEAQSPGGEASPGAQGGEAGGGEGGGEAGGAEGGEAGGAEGGEAGGAEGEEGDDGKSPFPLDLTDPQDILGLFLLGLVGLGIVAASANALKQLRGERSQADGSWRPR